VQQIMAILLERPKQALASPGKIGPSGGGRSSGGQHGGGSHREKRGLGSSGHVEPSSKKSRKKGGSCDGLVPNDFTKSHSVEGDGSELSDQSSSPERTHHGVHPLEWEVASSFSAIVDDESMQMGSVSGDSVGMLSKSDSEGDLGEFAPNMHT